MSLVTREGKKIKISNVKVKLVFIFVKDKSLILITPQYDEGTLIYGGSLIGSTKIGTPNEFTPFIFFVEI